MVAKMIEVGIIQHSQSFFFSLVVLVNKKDGSWCMCLNYRELNKLSIKDNFLFLLLTNCWMNYMEQFTSPRWIFVQYIIKLEWRLKTFRKQHLELMKVIMNFWSCPLALLMHLPHFKVWWIPLSNPSLEISRVFLMMY